MKRVNWHIPEAAGVNAWPNMSSTRDELRSQVDFTGGVRGGGFKRGGGGD